jgi:hypothetical protein
LVGYSDKCGFDLDASLFRVFHSIGDKVDKYLFDSVLVLVDKKIFAAGDFQSDSFEIALLFEKVLNFFKDFLQRELIRAKHDLADLYLRVIQNRVNQIQKQLAALLDSLVILLQNLHLALFFSTLHQLLDTVKRGFQVVRNRCQHLVLVPASLFELPAPDHLRHVFKSYQQLHTLLPETLL